MTGWLGAGETWVYASADDPTYTFTIAGVDKTTKYYPGMKVKLTQTTDKYFIITKVAFSTDTTITLYGGTDYDLANATITNPYYSVSKSPPGFSLDPLKWSLEASDTTLRTQASPVQNTWYNFGPLSLSIPIGAWRVLYSVAVTLEKSGGGQAQATLSTANNSESDVDFTSRIEAGGLIGTTAGKEKHLNLTSKTTYYLNSRTTTASVTNLYNTNSLSKAFIRIESAYL